jgi:hypothetical protein
MLGIGDSRQKNLQAGAKDRQCNLPNAIAEQMSMQDKFAIGPVTIVQLVGLTTKPRIASAQVDAAVRAADPLPPASAHAGIGQELLQTVGETSATFFDIKAPQALALTAAPMHASIGFEAGVDRAVAGESGPQPITVPFDLQGNFDLAALIAALRGIAPTPAPAPTPPADTAPTVPTAPSVEPQPPTAPGDVPAPGAPGDDAFVGGEAEDDGDAVFDGIEAFGDDKILDFEAYYKDSGFDAATAAHAFGGAGTAAIAEMEAFFAADPAFQHLIDTATFAHETPSVGEHDGLAPPPPLPVHDGIQPI